MWNAAAFTLHLVTALVVGLVGNRNLIAQYFVFDVSTRQRSQQDWLRVPTGAVEAGQLHIVGAIATFSAITAFFHFGNAFLWRETYDSYISEARNPIRWVEYSLSAGIMIVLIALFSGVVNTYVAALLFVLTSTTMFFGHLTERINRPSLSGSWELGLMRRLEPHLLGYLPLGAAFAVVILEFARYAMAEGTDPNGNVIKMPVWVWALFIGEIVLFWSFAVVQLWVLMSPPSKYAMGEKMYILLSFVSKATLAYIIFGGTMNLDLDNRQP